MANINKNQQHQIKATSDAAPEHNMSTATVSPYPTFEVEQSFLSVCAGLGQTSVI